MAATEVIITGVVPPFDPANYARAYEPPATVWNGTQPEETNATADYSPRTMAEKAAGLGVSEVVPVDVDANEPYPET